MGTRRRAAMLAATTGLALMLAGCGGGAEDSALTDDQVDAADEADVAGGATAAAQEPGAEDAAQEGEDGSAPGATNAADQLQLIYTGSITLSSDDPDETAEQVRQRATEAGGFVSATQLRRNELGLLTGTITIRVPADNFESLLAGVSETAASVVSEQRSVEDVSDRLRDIEANLRNLRALEQELLVLLEDARETGETEEVLRVFDRVNQVRGDIERLEATRANLGDQVALSTLTVEIQPSRSLVAEAQQVPEEDRPLPWSPGNQAETAWDTTLGALQGFVNFVIWLFVTVLPVLLVWTSPLVLGALAYRWWRRRNPKAESGPTWGSRPGAPGSGGPPPAPTVTPEPQHRGGQSSPDSDAGEAGTAEDGAQEAETDEQEREEVTTDA